MPRSFSMPPTTPTAAEPRGIHPDTALVLTGEPACRQAFITKAWTTGIWGLTVKSPQWMETFRYNTEDELGLPVKQTLDLDLPMVISVGTAWSGWEGLVIATDIRYYDYENTAGFEGSGFRPDVSVAGVGWDSIISVATGVQYEINPDLLLRGGYTFNENPIPDSQTFFNIGAPLFYQHELHVGMSYRLTKRLWLNFAYTYYFENEISGPVMTPAGAIPGSSVTSRETVHIADIGFTVRY